MKRRRKSKATQNKKPRTLDASDEEWFEQESCNSLKGGIQPPKYLPNTLAKPDANYEHAAKCKVYKDYPSDRYHEKYHFHFVVTRDEKTKVIQLLVQSNMEDLGRKYVIWQRTGRSGLAIDYQTKSTAVAAFKELFADLFGRDWEDYWDNPTYTDNWEVLYPYDNPAEDPEDFSSDEEQDEESMFTTGPFDHLDFLELDSNSQISVLEFCDLKSVNSIRTSCKECFYRVQSWSGHWLNTLHHILSTSKPYFKKFKQFPWIPPLATQEMFSQGELNEMTTLQSVDKMKLDLPTACLLLKRVNQARQMCTGLSDSNNYHQYTLIDLCSMQHSLRGASSLRCKKVSWHWALELSFQSYLNRFLRMKHINKFKGLRIGAWKNKLDNGCEKVINRLIYKKEKLAHLEYIYIGDVGDLFQMHWINLPDMKPLLDAFPQLKYFKTEGNLDLSPFTHFSLQSLTLESSGLRINTIQAVINSNLPNLCHLELWLGTMFGNGNSTWKEVKQVLGTLFTVTENGKFPSLQYLGLKNSQQIDKFCDLIVNSALVKRLLELDLSLGCLGNEGASELVKLKDMNTCLRVLNVKYNWITSRELVRQLLAMHFFVKHLNFACIEMMLEDDELVEEDETWTHRNPRYA